LTVRNAEGHNAIDLSVILGRKDILTLLVKFKQPKESSLVKAIQCHNPDLAKIIYTILKKVFKDDYSLEVLFERYFELNIEVSKKTILTQRKEVCCRNIDAYKVMICNYLTKPNPEHTVGLIIIKKKSILKNSI
jgi:hypothetical protein